MLQSTASWWLCHYPCAFASIFLASCVSVAAWGLDAHSKVRLREFSFPGCCKKKCLLGPLVQKYPTSLWATALCHQWHPKGEGILLGCLLQPNMKPCCLCGAATSPLLFPPALRTPSQPATVPKARVQCSMTPCEVFVCSATALHQAAAKAIQSFQPLPRRADWEGWCTPEARTGGGMPRALSVPAKTSSVFWGPHQNRFHLRSSWDMPWLSSWSFADCKRACCLSNTGAILVGLALIGLWDWCQGISQHVHTRCWPLPEFGFQGTSLETKVFPCSEQSTLQMSLLQLKFPPCNPAPAVYSNTERDEVALHTFFLSSLIFLAATATLWIGTRPETFLAPGGTLPWIHCRGNTCLRLRIGALTLTPYLVLTVKAFFLETPLIKQWVMVPVTQGSVRASSRSWDMDGVWGFSRCILGVLFVYFWIIFFSPVLLLTWQIACAPWSCTTLNTVMLFSL